MAHSSTLPGRTAADNQQRVATAKGKGIADGIIDLVRLFFRNHIIHVIGWIWDPIINRWGNYLGNEQEVIEECLRFRRQFRSLGLDFLHHQQQEIPLLSSLLCFP
jgi:hypothetical protein